MASSPEDPPASGQELAERVKSAIAARHGQLDQVAVDATADGTIQPSGRVASFHLRQLAVAAALAVEGVQHVSDGIAVGQ